MKKITLHDDSYWKLLEIKVGLKCRTWQETIDKIHKLISDDRMQK